MNPKIKRFLALAAVAVIALLYLATFLLSFVHSGQAGDFLLISLVATVVVPALLYIYLWLFRLFHRHDKND